jgi:hypothetical protein
MKFYIPPTVQRNREIFRLHRLGLKQTAIAEMLNMTTGRVGQILHPPGAEAASKRVPDIDHAPTVDLLAWAIPDKGSGMVRRAAAAFPSKPSGYTVAYHWLCVAANQRLRGESYEGAYDRLPEWARWRERFPVRACVAEGQRFRKRAPKTSLADLIPDRRKGRA